MEWIKEYSDYIRWLSALFLYPIFLLILPDTKERTKIRKTIYLIALPLFCISYGLGHTLTEFYRGLSQPAIISFTITRSAINAIVFTEFIRSMTKKGKLWNTKKHLITFVALTAILSAIRAITL